MSTITPLNNNMNNTSPVATIASYVAGLTGIVSGVTLDMSLFLSLLGAFFMVLTYFTNLYFKRRDDARADKLFRLKEKAYQARQVNNET